MWGVVEVQAGGLKVALSANTECNVRSNLEHGATESWIGLHILSRVARLRRTLSDAS